MKKLLIVLLLFTSSLCFGQKKFSDFDNTTDISTGSLFIISYKSGSTFATQKMTWDSLKNILGDSIVIVPAGNNTEIQYNNNGVFGSSSSLNFASGTLNLGTTVSTSRHFNIENSALSTTSSYTGLYNFHKKASGGGTPNFIGLNSRMTFETIFQMDDLTGGIIESDVNSSGAVADVIGLKVGMGIKSTANVSGNAYGLYITRVGDNNYYNRVSGNSYGVYIEDENWDYELYTDGNVYIGGTISGQTKKSTVQYMFDTPSSMSPDTIWGYINFTGGTVTIDSIASNSLTDDQDVKLVAKPWDGSSTSRDVIDDMTISTDGTDGVTFYNMETTISDAALENGKQIGFVKPSITSSNVVIVVFISFTKTVIE